MLDFPVLLSKFPYLLTGPLLVFKYGYLNTPATDAVSVHLTADVTCKQRVSRRRLPLLASSALDDVISQSPTEKVNSGRLPLMALCLQMTEAIGRTVAALTKVSIGKVPTWPTP